MVKRIHQDMMIMRMVLWRWKAAIDPAVVLSSNGSNVLHPHHVSRRIPSNLIMIKRGTSETVEHDLLLDATSNSMRGKSLLLSSSRGKRFKQHLNKRFLSSSHKASPQKPSSDRLKPSSDHPEISLIRNVGIIAHIDAGKTTTTERMLYYSGLIDNLGEVHDGDTVTDYMEQERTRGITITSASVTYPWKKHRINLIDTPGHVDFTVEVERCLSVLDSALVVLDSSAGVEAQTLTVWSQADRFSIPRLVYLNKMDRNDSDIDLCLNSIKKLGSKPLLIHLPIKSPNPKIPEKKDLTGIVDVIKMEKLIWSSSSDPLTQLNSDGSVYDTLPLDPVDDKDLYQEALNMREDIIGSLSDFDERLSEAVLNDQNLVEIPHPIIMNALRRGTISRKVVPVLVGSSYKNMGVQSLMDAMLQFLPSPIEVIKKHSKYYNQVFCGLAFKIIHHKRFGALTFIRIYSGQLKPGTKIFNVNRNAYESVQKIYLALADEFKEIPLVTAGNIVAVTGLTCVTGDTLVDSQKSVDEAKTIYAERHPEAGSGTILLAGPSVPTPVFFCTVESPSPSKEKTLMFGLENLQREDPSLKVEVDENGQIQMSGMGELHMEIIKDRLLKEYGVDAYMGPLQVAYRESIDKEVTEELTLTKIIGGVKNVVTVKVALKPIADRSNNEFKVIVTPENMLGQIWAIHLKAIQNGIDSAMRCGPQLNFPIFGIRTELLQFQCSSATTPAFISSTISQVLAMGLKKTAGNLCLLEPLMELEITVPLAYSTKIISDLSSRRSNLTSVSERNEIRLINSKTPLSELFNYSSALRTLSSGTATLNMRFLAYQKMNEAEKKVAKEKVTGIKE